MGVFLMRFATRALQRWFARAFDAALGCAAALVCALLALAAVGAVGALRMSFNAL